ncbi:MAG: GNAT family N-acetyltransferase [Leptolyngbyaceae cyanobacterium SL_7_1]|nr:GNAT family N-acetyltransferase [Leptolyngbyaceae cyanobacterium SL_7_1]
MQTHFRDFLIRDWQPSDRLPACELIRSVLAEYGLSCEPEGCDRDVFEVEQAYWQAGGEFWVVETADELVGTAAYYPIERSDRTVEIRKMYLVPSARGQGLGRFLLQSLERAIAAKGFEQIRIETSTKLVEAVLLYERHGYFLGTDVETQRCDRVYIKRIS